MPQSTAKATAGHHFMQLLDTATFRQITTDQTIHQVGRRRREELGSVLDNTANDIANIGVR
ncbi:hypothetical protein D3C85_1384730 [compost metagenome]